MRIRTALGAALAMLASWRSPADAVTITIFTDKAEWLDAVGGQFQLEDFADDQLNAGLSFVSTESGHINPAQECYQDVLASQSQNEPTTIWSFTPAVNAYGGNWALGGPGGSGNSLLVYIDDVPVYVGAISNSFNGGFWGFTSDAPFTSVRLVGGAGGNQQNYCLDDMVYAPGPDPICPWDSAPAPPEGPDGVVGLGDLNALLSNWGACPAPPDACPWDFNDPPDGTVGLGDLNALLSNWGPCP